MEEVVNATANATAAAAGAAGAKAALTLTPSLALAYGSTLVAAAVPIWLGAYRSLSLSAQIETMSSREAWMFPVIGSCVLFGLYILFKVFSPELINLLLSSYFLLFGVFAIHNTVLPFVQSDEAAHAKSGKKPRTPLVDFSVRLPLWSDEPIKVKFTLIEAVVFVFALSLGMWYFRTKSWVANNILGFCFSVQGIALISTGTYKIAAMLLTGLFFYDIFWVFGTDVMVTVARSFDAPIKLLFPKNVFEQGSGPLAFSMLGLGDIVLPGLLLALLLRFDLSLLPAAVAGGKKKAAAASASRLPVYFTATLCAYVFGLATTIFVMHVFQAAQPALLYLVPACLLGSFLTAVVRGEVGKLMAYSEAGDDDDNKDDGKSGGSGSSSKKRSASATTPKKAAAATAANTPAASKRSASNTTAPSTRRQSAPTASSTGGSRRRE